MIDIALPRVTRPRTETTIPQRMFAVPVLGAGIPPGAAAAAPPTVGALTASVSPAVAFKAAATMSWTCCAFCSAGTLSPIGRLTDYINTNAASKDLRTQPWRRVHGNQIGRAHV